MKNHKLGRLSQIHPGNSIIISQMVTVLTLSDPLKAGIEQSISLPADCKVPFFASVLLWQVFCKRAKQIRAVHELMGCTPLSNIISNLYAAYIYGTYYSLVVSRICSMSWKHLVLSVKQLPTPNPKTVTLTRSFTSYC